MSDEPLLHIVLVQPEIPQNAGNIGRTCVALGAKLWLVRPLGFRLDERHLRRAGLDYWQHLEWEAVDDWAALRQRLPEPEPWLFTKTAERLYTTATFRSGDCLGLRQRDAGLAAYAPAVRPRPLSADSDAARSPQSEPGLQRGHRRLRGKTPDFAGA